MSQSAAARSVGLRRAATSTGALALVAAAATATAGAASADQQYTVRSGDTVSHIATRNGSTVSAIARANALADVSRIRIGQVLTIPTGAAASSQPVAAAAAPVVVAQPVGYSVVSGDTVGRIAAKYGTTVRSIVEANGLNARATIRIGQSLTIPGAAAAQAPVAVAAPAAASSTAYVVRSGDTVSSVAKKIGSSIDAIVAANGLDARARIRIGQTLTVPVAATAPTSAGVGNTFAGRTYSDPVVAAANANLATLSGTATPSKAQMQAKIAAAATAMGVDPALAQAVAFQESGFNHAVVSPANAIGAMQVIPSSGVWASELVGRQLNLVDPDDNVVAGVAILRSLVNSAPDLPTAIAGYYQGATSVKRNGMFADTRRYVANVQTHMTRFR
ncbi:LysM peptidoglycan-binding domain-containing protein [Cellulomonas sp. URHE0023]|uniref:LysM peptidoglycan-binding domain-containing protein n=1 Tax=Cellulomonas sp. URHE0023 TaxID=1380354 RepID=UPI000489515F|nr:LysM peptidoglycan-binding domain-containing protein [Cellulomonas sp. URHE0023]